MSVGDFLSLECIDIQVPCRDCGDKVEQGSYAWITERGAVTCRDCVDRARENAENQKGAPSWVDS